MKYLSPLLSDARASIGGATASKNRGGNYFRARIAPIQPRTPAQQDVRSNLSSLSSSWRSLTQLQIAGWNALAATVTLKDTLGNSYKPTGAQLFVGNNMNNITVGNPLITTPPALKPDFPAAGETSAAATAATPTFIVTVGYTAAPGAGMFIVRATPQLSAGISFIGQSQYRVIGTFNSIAIPSFDILSDYTAKFGTLVAGTVVGIQVVLIAGLDGFASIASSTSTIVAT